ncbi:MAG: ferric reductase-like transmembrane domain-containing protein [Ancalomicrobiaceae bacterium]|nr:ferric reductase-like transmembrane domain-containing protein [Ancalomicrobiaceae bacterium]
MPADTLLAAFPWNDRRGRFSPLRAVVLAGLIAPAVWILLEWHLGWLGPRVLNEAIHQTGEWTVRFLLLALAVTPLRHATGWTRLIGIRRLTGLAALFYVLAHFSLYCVDQRLDILRIASEIVLRIYLTIGFTALLGLVALGATSTDGMIRRLGGLRWRRLHSIVHAIAVLAMLHFFMQSKIDTYEATLMLGVLLILEGCRLIVWRGFRLAPAALALNAVVAAALTALLEAGWYGLATRVPASAVFAANLELDDLTMLRPAWWVLVAGLGLAVLAWGIAAVRNRRRPQRMLAAKA